MNHLSLLHKHIATIDAELEIRVSPNRDNTPSWDVATIAKKEFFTLSLGEKILENVRADVLDIDKKLRHILLLMRSEDKENRCLLGFDERHLFVASIRPEYRDLRHSPRNMKAVKTIQDAMESLKPVNAIGVQIRNEVKPKDWNKRHNEGFLRQGEWFFIPIEGKPMAFQEWLILKDEPLSRGRGSKPHIVSEVYRFGGELVYTCPQYPNGVRELEYHRIIQRNPKARSYNWIPQRLNARVFARGTVRHPDHKTLYLSDWHQVAMNGEERNGFVGFLD